jgi:uncharacterized protein (DUF983 family)
VTEERRPLTILMRCLRLRCPVCGRSSIAQTPFKIKDHCPLCGAHFKREEGFFVGAISVNVVTTEVVILAVYLASLPLIASHYELVISILLTFALLFPVAFYHHSWSLWLSLDHLVEKLPRDAKLISGQAGNGNKNGGAEK